MLFIDTHCHLYLPEFETDLDDIVKRANAAGVRKFYLPAIDSNVINQLLNAEKEYPQQFFAMMGLHPCFIMGNYKNELDIVHNWLMKRQFAAIGEIGLDFYWDTNFMTQQYEAFEIQMEWALEKKLPVVIHTRKAMQQTIDFLKPFSDKGLKGIFHCFGDSYEMAKQIIDMDFFLGIGGVLTYKNSGLAEVIKNISLNHVVLETDAPYLSPIPFRGKRNESSYLKIIAEKLAAIKNVSIEEVADITTSNAEKIFGAAG